MTEVPYYWSTALFLFLYCSAAQMECAGCVRMYTHVRMARTYDTHTVRIVRTHNTHVHTYVHTHACACVRPGTLHLSR